MAEIPKPTAREIGIVVLRAIFSWPFAVAATVLLTLPWWMSGYVYWLLRSYLFAPSGVIVWTALLVSGGIATVVLVLEFRGLIRSVKGNRQLRQRAKDDEPGAYEALMEARRTIPRDPWHSIFAVMLQFAIAPVIAMSVWNMTDGMRRKTEQGWQPVPREHVLRGSLRGYEEEGVWTLLSRSRESD